MCYLVREHGSEAREGAATPPVRIKPRWVGAGAATLVAGLAVAALMAPQPTGQMGELPQRADTGPVAAEGKVLPAAFGGDKAALPADDGVPTSPTEVVKAAGSCHHGL